MTVPIQNLRSGVASKRPVATGLAVGQIAINYNENDPAIYLRGDADALIKVSPTFVGSTAPNATPSGSSGNSKGETWLDTSTSPATLKIWNGSAWNSTYTLPSGSVLLSGVTAATAATGDNSTLVATTAFVNAEIANDAPTKAGGGATGTWAISITGDAGGNAATATALQTARTISLAGDLSGSATFDGTSNVTISGIIGANSVALGTDTTGNYVAAGATTGNGISGSVSSEGGTFTVTSNATNANTANTIVYRDASGNFSAGTISAALSGNASTATTLQTARTINGTSFNGSANIVVEPYIEDDETTNATRYIVFTDNSEAGYKRLNEDSSLSYNPSTNTLTAGTFNGSLAGNASSATTATTATSANALTTARTISLGGDLSGSASFDGSENVTISATIGANSVALGTDTTGNYVGAGATSGNGISGSVSSEGGTFTVSSNATNANTANTIVFRDANGNFSAGTISAALNGNASTATTLQTTRTINGVNFNGSANITVEPYIENDDSTNATRYLTFVDDSTANFKRLNEDANLTYNPATNTLTAGTFSGSLTGNASSATTATTATTANSLATARTISLGGDLSGSASFDGSANVTISATIGANSVALGTDTTGNYVGAGATSGNGISGSVSNEGGTFTVTSNATSANTANTIVYRNASGNFSAGTITATLNGNASTASSASSAATLTTARTINGVSFNGSANIITNPSSTSGAAYSNGYGGRYVSTSSPTGGNNGDIWYKVA